MTTFTVHFIEKVYMEVQIAAESAEDAEIMWKTGDYDADAIEVDSATEFSYVAVAEGGAE